MNWKIIAVAVAILFVTGIIAWSPKSYTPVRFYNSAGEMRNTMRIFADTITPNTSNGYSMDISAAGFTRILSVNAIASRNTATATSVANVGVKTWTNSSIVFNSTEGNASLVTLLGSSVLLGPSTGFAAVGIQLHVTVIGY